MPRIWTINGWMDEAELTHFRLIKDNENEYTVRDEWRDSNGVEVRSDVHVTIKKQLPLSPEQGAI